MHLRCHVEASSSIGHGHVIRCAAIAEAAREKGILTSFVAANGYTKCLLSKLGLTEGGAELADLVVIDHHTAAEPAAVHELQVQGATVALLDQHSPARILADLVCDALIAPETRAQLPHSDKTRYCYGLDYVLLRKQFTALHAAASPGRRAQPRLMVAMGGVDQYLVARRLAVALSACGFAGPATFVVERGAVTALQAEVAHWENTRVLSDVAEMALLMVDCDLLLTKLGGLVFEGFCVGIGAALVEPSQAHVALSASLAATHANWPTYPLGLAAELNFYAVAQDVIALLHQRSTLEQMGRRGAELIDGCGCDRLLDELLAKRAQS